MSELKYSQPLMLSHSIELRACSNGTLQIEYPKRLPQVITGEQLRAMFRECQPEVVEEMKAVGQSLRALEQQAHDDGSMYQCRQCDKGDRRTADCEPCGLGKFQTRSIEFTGDPYVSNPEILYKFKLKTGSNQLVFAEFDKRPAGFDWVVEHLGHGLMTDLGHHLSSLFKPASEDAKHGWSTHFDNTHAGDLITLPEGKYFIKCVPVIDAVVAPAVPARVALLSPYEVIVHVNGGTLSMVAYTCDPLVFPHRTNLSSGITFNNFTDIESYEDRGWVEGKMLTPSLNPHMVLATIDAASRLRMASGRWFFRFDEGGLYDTILSKY